MNSKFTIAKGDKIILNYNNIRMLNPTSSSEEFETGVTTDAYLYRNTQYITTNLDESEQEHLGACEVLGDTESIGNPTSSHYAIMFAMWEVNIYTVKLDVNSRDIDSIQAQYDFDAIDSSSAYDDANVATDIITIELKVEFDTNVWFYNTSNSGVDLTNVIVKKLGYFWIGWYSHEEAVEQQDYLTHGTDYHFENSYNKYADYRPAFVDEEHSCRTDAVVMREFDYALFNQFVFRIYGEKATYKTSETGVNDYYDLRSTLTPSDINGYTFDTSTTSGNWIEKRNFNPSTKVENNQFQVTIYAKWQGIIFETSFNDTSLGDDSGIGSTTAYFITETDGTSYTSQTAMSNAGTGKAGKMYVMFDTNVYTSNYLELLDDESDYEQNINGVHIEHIINVDRYGYTWTGWFTRGYETRTETTATDGSKFYRGSMSANSMQVIDGHDSNLLTFGNDSDYARAFNSTDCSKFDITLYNTLQTANSCVAAATGTEYQMTLYAGWKANTYNVYYESNDVTRDVVGTNANGSSISYKITHSDNVAYALTILFDADDVETTAFQRVGYTFTGYSLGHEYVYTTYGTLASKKAKSTKVRIDYPSIKYQSVDNPGTSGTTTDCYLYENVNTSNGTAHATTVGKCHTILPTCAHTNIYLDNRTTQTNEHLGDDQKTFAIILEAFYEANEYTVNFERNKNNGSTIPYFEDLSTAAIDFDLNESNYEDELYIVFDTNEWKTKDGSNVLLEDIKVDRYGYTWMGWYTRSKVFNIASANDSNTWAAFYRYIVASGSASNSAASILNKLDYNVYLSFFNREYDATLENTNYVATDADESTSIVWNYDDSTYQEVNDNSFYVQGDFVESYNIHTISISAGWQANTYDVTYYFSDVNSAKNNNNNNWKNGADYNYITTSPIETQSVGYFNEAGSLVTVNTAFTSKLVFDKEYDYVQFLTRIGYRFKGWRFGLDSNVTFGENQKVILDANSIAISLLDNETKYVEHGRNVSGNYYDSYLFINNIHQNVAYDIVTDNPENTRQSNYKKLGDYELLGDIHFEDETEVYVDAKYSFNVDGNGTCTGLTFTETHHNVQMFAMWENVVYSVEFNVNHNYKSSEGATADADSSVANYVVGLARLTNSTIDVVDECLTGGLSDAVRYTTSSLIGMLSDIKHKTGYLPLDAPDNTEESLLLRSDYNLVSNDFITFEYNGNGADGEPYKYVAYVTFDTNDWWFETIDGTRIDDALYYLILQKFGYYFQGWFTNTYCVESETETENDVVLKYYEGEGYENNITGHYELTQKTSYYKTPDDMVTSYLVALDYSFYSKFSKTSQGTRTKFGLKTSGDWVEDRENEIYTITLYAKWENKVYTVANFDTRSAYEYGDDTTQSESSTKLGSTQAFFSVKPNPEFVYDNYAAARETDNGLNIRVVFDTDVWYAQYDDGTIYGGGSEYLNNILVDRYGYTWLGWFTDESLQSIRIIDGHKIDSDEGKNHTTYTSDYTEKCVSRKFDIDAAHDLNDENFKEDLRTFTLYAGWDANVYKVHFDYCDVNSDYGVGSSEATFTDYQTFTTTTVEFDKGVDYVPRLMRNGYEFVGWRFGTPYESENETIMEYAGTGEDLFTISNDDIFRKTQTATNKVYLFTEDHDYDDYEEKYGDTEELNDYENEAYVHFVICFAVWRQIEYTVQFDSNQKTGTSTTPRFVNRNGEYVLDNAYTTIKVKFDEENWFESGSLAESEIDNILVDRYGYTWMGWYTHADNWIDGYTSSELTNNYPEYTLVIDGNSRRGATVNEAVLGTNYANVFNNHLFSTIFGERGHESDTTNTIITLYAGWEANRYSIVYDFSDAGSKLVYLNGNRPAIQEKDPLTGAIVGEYQAGYSQRKVGSTYVKTQLSYFAGLTNPSTVLFDTTYISSAFTNFAHISRTGYIFNGWTLDDSDDVQLQSNFLSANVPNNSFVLNYTYAHNTANSSVSCFEDNADTSGSSYLRYFINGEDNYTSEKLGDTEANEEHVIVLYANWTARIYTVEFDLNDYYRYINDTLAQGISASTFASTEFGGTGLQVDSTTATGAKLAAMTSVSYRIKFDTSNWYAVGTYSGQSTQIDNVLKYLYASRIGYTFIGWYTTRTMNNGVNPDNPDLLISSLVYKAIGDDNTEFTLSDATYNLDPEISSENTGYVADKNAPSGSTKLFAGWKQNEYTAIFELRDTNTTEEDWKLGTTDAVFGKFEDGSYFDSYSDLSAPRLTKSEFEASYQLKVLFDENNYTIYKDGVKLANNNTLYHILVDRYGYTWTGWYVHSAANKLNFTQTGLVSGHTASLIPSSASEIPVIENFNYRLHTYASAYNETIEQESNRKFYLFAGWDANTYEIVYDLNDYDHAINIKDEDGIHGIGSTNATYLTQNPTASVTFDKTYYDLEEAGLLTYYQVLIERRGYEFNGWSLHSGMDLNGEACTFGVNDEEFAIVLNQSLIKYAYTNNQVDPPETSELLLLYSTYMSDVDCNHNP